MGIRVTKWLYSFIALLFITGCDIVQLTDEPPALDIEGNSIEISDLIETENFRPGALKHILEGEINRKGDAVGFHYEGLPSVKGIVIEGTRTNPDKYGIYEAEVEVEGIKKRGNRGMSTFFPLHWNAQEVVDSINEAYDSKQFLNGNTYEGVTDEGVVIHMYLDKNDKIISAFPVH